MTDWQDAFTKYTTGFAFSLTLSRDMASLIEAIGSGAWGEWASASGRATFIGTFRSLERRGLAEHNPAMLAANLPANARPKWVYRLTPAGRHVLSLLQLSGVTSAVASVETLAS